MFNLLLLATFCELSKLLFDTFDLFERLVRFCQVRPKFVDFWLKRALLLLLKICIWLLNVLPCVLTLFDLGIEVETFVPVSHSVLSGFVVECDGPESRLSVVFLLLLDVLRLIALLLCHELLLAKQLVRNLEPLCLHLLPALKCILFSLLGELYPLGEFLFRGYLCRLAHTRVTLLRFTLQLIDVE